jgi:Domain of unknown function (DUF4157)
MRRQRRSPAPSARISPVGLQRSCACGRHAGGGRCEGCRSEQAASQRPAVTSTPPIVQAALSSPGQQMDAATRSDAEARFGRDFSRVRIHTDAKAAESARVVQALAYTVGSDVVFAADRYSPGTAAGRRLLAHELTHVLQQRRTAGLAGNGVGAQGDRLEQQAAEGAKAVGQGRRPGAVTLAPQPVLQRDLARPPRGTPAPVRELTPEQVAAAITYNEARFRDPYSIRVIRDVVGVAPLPAVVDEELVRAVAAWQAERRMTQDGRVGHASTRSIFLELVAEDQLRDAIVLAMDAYALPESRHLHDIRIGTGADCCGTVGAAADAVTSGGMGTPQPVQICFCRPRIPRTAADYDHFVRIIGHELIHVPQRAANLPSQPAREFEAWFWEACAEGRARRLTPAARVAHAQTALRFFAGIPAALRTPARIRMRDQLNALIAAGGVGPC